MGLMFGKMGIGLKVNGKNNVREGEGTLVLANGNIIKGTWSNDLLNGPIEITSKDGKLLERSIYKDNRRIKVLKR